MIINDFNKYSIDDNGLIINSITGKIYKQYKNRDGYMAIYLYKDKKRYFRQVHRLVAQAFIKNDYDKPFVNHKDGKKDNNKVGNLEWCTASENIKHSFRLGLSKGKKGEQHGMSKLKESHIYAIFKFNNEGYSIKSISKIFNVSSVLIGMVLNRKIWKHINTGLEYKKVMQTIGQFDKEGNKIAEFKSQHMIQDTLGYNQGLISRVLRGKGKTAYNFIWKYV